MRIFPFHSLSNNTVTKGLALSAMDTQMSYSHQHDHHHKQSPRTTGLHGEDGDQREKKSVLKKVKAKAKKIKDTLTSHAHGHIHDHGREYAEGLVPDDHDLAEEDDEDDEMVDDPEINGVSGYERAAIRSSVPGHMERSGDKGETVNSNDPRREQSDGQLRVALGRTPNIEEVPNAPANTPVPVSSSGILEQRKDTDRIEGFVRDQEARRGQPEVGLEVPTGLEEDPHAPKDKGENYTPSDYQAKTIDPTAAGGGDEAGDSPILTSFQKMNIQDEPKQETKENISTGQEGYFSAIPGGSHDQFSSDLTPPELIRSQDSPQTDRKPFENSSPRNQPPSQGSYTGKITSATSAIADKAISAKNVIASKLGYSVNSETSDGQDGSPVENWKKIAAIVTEKLDPVAGAGSSLMSKVENPGGSSEGQDKGVSVKDYFVEKLKPGEEDKVLSEIISETLFNKEVGNARVEKEDEDRPTGKVTESEEVKRRLGSSNKGSGERADSDHSSARIPGSGVVDKLKGAVGWWFAKGDTPTEQESLGIPTGVQGSSTAVSGEESGKKMLQESGN